MNPRKKTTTGGEDDRTQGESNQTAIEEDGEEYRLAVYGDSDIYSSENDIHEKRRSSSVRRLSKRLSDEFSRRRSSVMESLPETPGGWAVLLLAVSSAALSYEVQLQKSLTCPPIVYGQQGSESPVSAIYKLMTTKPDSIVTRPIQPSLFVGTRSVMSSTVAFLMRGGPRRDQHVCFREVVNMTQDGARLALDWELPVCSSNLTNEGRRKEILQGPIQKPIALILHGLNNDASFGYVRSMMRACTDRGWNAVGMNMRGSGGVPLETPRGYNGAYTGDIRCVVQILSARLADGVPIVLAGHSLGANLITKYLGEEGLSGTLPKAVAGGVALGNPMYMNSHNIATWISPVMALGAKKSLLENWSSIRKVQEKGYQAAIRKALAAVTLGDFDEALAPLFARNDPIYPFAFRTGFKNGGAYHVDASSYRLVRFVSVPMLQLVAGDDFIVSNPFRGRLAYSLANPNIMVVETKCGGHLGWQESPPGGFGVLGTSWADTAVADFFEAVLKDYYAKHNTQSDEALTKKDEPWSIGNEAKLSSSVPKPLRSRL